MIKTEGGIPAHRSKSSHSSLKYCVAVRPFLRFIITNIRETDNASFFATSLALKAEIYRGSDSQAINTC